MSHTNSILPAAGVSPAVNKNGASRAYIVDDHPMIRLGLAQLLSSAGLHVCGETASAEVALREIAALRPELVLSDLELRGNSALELIQSIRALDSQIAIIVVSFHPENTYALRSLRAGARGYVMKQDAPARIIEAIQRVTAGGVYASERVMRQAVMGIRNGLDASGSTAETLSERELEVLELIGRGSTTREIAAQLHVSIKTVETHRQHIKHKLQLENSTQLIQNCAVWVRQRDLAAGL